jgi:putative transposase
MMTYQFIAVHSNEYSVALMCSVLAVSVSGYYAWRKREPSLHSREDVFLAEKIVEAFQHNRRFPRLFYDTTSLMAFSALFT